MSNQSSLFPRAAAYLLLFLSLLWPAFILGHPLVHPDTPAYFKAGHLAAKFIWDTLSSDTASFADMFSARTRANLVPDSAVGIRSAYYGLFVWLLGRMSLWAVVMAQVAIILYAVHRFLSSFLKYDFRISLLAVLILATVSSLPWFTSLLMPDLLAGVSILLITVLLFRRGNDRPRAVLLDCGLILFSLVSHTSILLLAIVLTFVAFAIAAVSRKRPWARLPPLRVVLLGATVGMAVAANMVVSYVAFGTIGLTARTPPFLLARSIINGPGRLYLEENCHKPGKDYFVCGHLGDMPPSVAEFLWDPRGIYMSATPDQRARIRAEQTEIVLNAAAAHPWTQLRSSFENVWRNLITFHVRDFRIELGLQDDELGYRASVKSPSVAIVAARETSSQFIYASTVISLVFLVGLVIRFGFSALPPVTWFVFFALISNATITGALSSEAPRYQARVIWLVPLVTIVCAAAAFRTWSKKDSQSEKRPAI